MGAVNVGWTMFPVLRVAAGSEIKTCASQSSSAVLDATRHYAQFAGPENDSTVAELNDHFAAPNEEKFVFMFVVVPWKHSRKISPVSISGHSTRQGPSDASLTGLPRTFRQGMLSSSCAAKNVNHSTRTHFP